MAKTYKQGFQNRGGQNLFVITKYRGADPKPVLEDIGSITNGIEQFDISEGNPRVHDSFVQPWIPALAFQKGGSAVRFHVGQSGNY